MLTQKIDRRFLAGRAYALVSEYASGDAAALAAYTDGVPLWVKDGETAVLTCNPTTGDDIQAMAKWFTSCHAEEGATFYIELADGGHTVSTFIDLLQPGLPLDIRASAAPSEIEVTAISYAAVSGTTYRATVTLASAVPAANIVGSPIGLQNIQGDNDAKSANGGQIIQSIAVDRLSFTFDFSSPKAAPTSPTAMDGTAINGITPNRVLCPKAFLIAQSTGWDGGAREGFINLKGGGRATFRYFGIAYSGAAGTEHDLIFARDTGSRFYAFDKVILAGAGDKVLRQYGGSEMFINRSCIGGAALAQEIWQGTAGSLAEFVRTSMGGTSTAGLTAGSGVGFTASQCVMAASINGIMVTGAGPEAAWQVSQISNCTNGMKATVGSIFTDSVTLVERCTNGILYDDKFGAVYGTPTFSGNTNDIVVSVAHPGLYLGGDASTNLFNYYSTGSFTPNLQFGGVTTGTFSAQNGQYTRIGREVFIKIELVLTNKGAATGNARITGLPFAATASLIQAFPIASHSLVDIDVAGARYGLYGQISANSTAINLFEMGDNVGVAALTDADFGNTSRLYINASYITDA